MIRNYLKTAIRSLSRYRLFTLLNIFGLASGMACAILIFLWVQDELSYDKFNSHAAQIYRMTANVAGSDAAVTPLPVAPVVKEQIPEIKNFTRLVALHSIVTAGGNKFDEKDIYYTDAAFFQMFDYPLIQGDRSTVLTHPGDAVITAAAAKKYFGDVNAIGKIIAVDDDVKGHNYIVSGVLKDIPHNSHLQFDVLLPLGVYERSSNYNLNNQAEWSNFDGYTYLQVNDRFKANAADIGSIERQINDIHTKATPPILTPGSPCSRLPVYICSAICCLMWKAAAVRSR